MKNQKLTKKAASKIFADRLQDLLVEKKTEGKDLATVAKELGISSGALSNYQNNQAEVKINTLTKIANYFDVSCDYLTGRIATKMPEHYSLSDEFGFSDNTIDRLRELKSDGNSWVLNQLFEDGLAKIIHEVGIVYERKERCERVFADEYDNREFYDNYGYLDDEIISDDGTFILDEKILKENEKRIINDKEHEKLALNYLREHGEHVNFVPAGSESVAIGMVNVLIEVNQYLTWRFNAVAEKAKTLFIDFFQNEI